MPKEDVKPNYKKKVLENGKLKGTIDISDVQYGNLWTNISDDLIKPLNLKVADVLHLIIYPDGKKAYEGDAPYSSTFGQVAKGKP